MKNENKDDQTKTKQSCSGSPLMGLVMRDFKDGMTVKDLKNIVDEWSEVDSVTGENCEVWIEVGETLSSPVRRITPLNYKKNDGESHADILLGSFGSEKLYLKESQNVDSNAAIYIKVLEDALKKFTFIELGSLDNVGGGTLLSPGVKVQMIKDARKALNA